MIVGQIMSKRLQLMLVQQTYYNMIKAGVGTTIAEAEDDYFGDAKTVDVKYVQVPYTTIADSLVEVTKSDIKAYMKNHEENYKRMLVGK